MARRTVLTSQQRAARSSLPQREAERLGHYILGEEDLQNIGPGRRHRNKLGFALPLCGLCYPGRLLALGERSRDGCLKLCALGEPDDFSVPTPTKHFF